MAKTLLDGTNDLLKKVESIDSDGALTSLSDTARQSWIDNAIAAINETNDLLYELPGTPDRPQQVSTNTITLATNDQDYALQTDLVRLLPHYGLVDRTNNHYIIIDDRPGAHSRLILGDLDQDDTGLPHICAIDPEDGQLWMDRKPTANENGRTYTYYYEKDLGMSVAADTFPYADPVYRAVINAAAELYMKINHREYDDRYFNKWLARAASRLNQFPRRTSWGEYAQENTTDPFEAA